VTTRVPASVLDFRSVIDTMMCAIVGVIIVKPLERSATDGSMRLLARPDVAGGLL
jgi:hypothetical protein